LCECAPIMSAPAPAAAGGATSAAAAVNDDPRMGSVLQAMPLPAFLQITERDHSPPPSSPEDTNEGEEGQETSKRHRDDFPRRASPHFRPTVVLTGFPHDEGCRRNGGRPGARDGPKIARQFINKLGTVVNPETGINLHGIEMYDVGDVEADVDLETAHRLHEKRVRSILSSASNVVCFSLGGSNDQSYPNASALMTTLGHGSIGVVNIDAHLDVRPLKDGKVHSGSPFRQLLEDVRFASSIADVDADGRPQQQFLEFAAQGSQCSRVHADFVTRTHRQRIEWLSDVRQRAGQFPPPPAGVHGFEAPILHQHGVGAVFEQALDSLQGEALFVSFDLDSVTGADAPGVSCPGTIGLTAQEALDMCFVAGRNPRVRLFDLSEFNPHADEYRTGRLVANMWYWFNMGVAQREVDFQRNKH